MRQGGGGGEKERGIVLEKGGGKLLSKDCGKDSALEKGKVGG